MTTDSIPIDSPPTSPSSSHLQARRRVSSRGPINLLAMLTPAILFPIGLYLLRNNSRFLFLHSPTQYPWELWILATSGLIATTGGTLDWLFHRSGQTSVGRTEHLSHLAALAGGGLPLFILMSIASLISNPKPLLIPIILVVIATVVLICYDEFVFHRKRCDRFETLTHRLLVFGNAIAWLAWMHWCFVRGGMNV